MSEPKRWSVLIGLRMVVIIGALYYGFMFLTLGFIPSLHDRSLAVGELRDVTKVKIPAKGGERFYFRLLLRDQNGFERDLRLLDVGKNERETLAWAAFSEADAQAAIGKTVRLELGRSSKIWGFEVDGRTLLRYEMRRDLSEKKYDLARLAAFVLLGIALAIGILPLLARRCGNRSR